MPTIAKTFFLLAASLVIFGLLSAAESQFSLPPETPNLKPGPGLELVNSQCLLCHSADYISTQPRLTSAQWQAVVVKMQTRYGAPVPTNKVDTLVDYLVENYGTRAVGKALPSTK